MTPKEKANDLVGQFKLQIDEELNNGFTYDVAKQCAIICVEQIINLLNEGFGVNVSIKKEYWNEVKEEIKKL